MNPQSYPLTIIQGSDFEFNFQIRNKGGAYWNIIGWTARMQVRTFPTSPTALLSISTSDYIDLSENGTVTILVPASVTSTLKAVNGVYDIELVNPSGAVYKPLRGSVRIEGEVTR
jgi:hypothetical protein